MGSSVMLQEKTFRDTAKEEFSDSGRFIRAKSDKWHYALGEAERVAGHRVPAVWTQDGKLQKQMEGPLPLTIAPLVASLMGTLRV